MPLIFQYLIFGRGLPGNKASATRRQKKIEITMIDTGSLTTWIGDGRLDNFSSILLEFSLTIKTSFKVFIGKIYKSTAYKMCVLKNNQRYGIY